MADITQAEGAAALFQMRAGQADSRLSAAQSATSQKTTSENTELEQASRQFEAMLLNMMIREMRDTVPDSGLFQKTMAEDIFTSMLDEQYADAMANSGGIGLARMIVEQLQTDPSVSRQTGGKKAAYGLEAQPATLK